MYKQFNGPLMNLRTSCTPLAGGKGVKKLKMLFYVENKSKIRPKFKTMFYIKNDNKITVFYLISEMVNVCIIAKI